MKATLRWLPLCCSLLLFWIAYSPALPLSTTAQDDTVKAPSCTAPPIIDGSGADACWSEPAWQAIDQVWIPWGGRLEPADYSGRYKVTWSPETGKLYFLVDIIDDVLVKGYTYPASGCHNYDVVEIFIDEDRSGGDHTHNNNAFAYHVSAGNSQRDYEVIDLQQGWDPYDFSSHLAVVIESDGPRYTWEMALTVYNDRYRAGAADNPVVELSAGKIMGLSLAYCDNDDPDEEPKTRDNFIGSVPVPSSKYNDHWQDASDFGVLRLVPSGGGMSVDESSEATMDQSAAGPQAFRLGANYPNPFNSSTLIPVTVLDAGELRLEIFDALGRRVSRQTLFAAAGSNVLSWDGCGQGGAAAPSGLYFYRVVLSTGDSRRTGLGKMLLVR